MDSNKQFKKYVSPIPRDFVVKREIQIKPAQRVEILIGLFQTSYVSDKVN